MRCVPRQKTQPPGWKAKAGPVSIWPMRNCLVFVLLTQPWAWCQNLWHQALLT